MQCNKHVVKMVTETAQLLATCFPNGSLRFWHTHFGHRCGRWVRSSLSNYKWLLLHGIELADEYTRRYGKVHGSADVLDACLFMTPDIPDVGLTPFARAIKEPWATLTAQDDVVTAYRKYYVGDKSGFARWAPRARAPDWWPDPGA